MDNLNTQDFGAFCKLLSAEEAFELSQRFEFFFTPVKGFWLNMAEIELSSFARICLDYRPCHRITTSNPALHARV
jgi:hypothetical protein